MDPDQLVAAHGETIDLIRLTVPVYDENDELDLAASTIETVQVKAIAAAPSEKDVRRLEGRTSIPTLRLTVPSATDILADRAGRPDRVRRGGRLYEVEEVRDDTHFLVGTRKKTVLLASMPGRE